MKKEKIKEAKWKLHCYCPNCNAEFSKYDICLLKEGEISTCENCNKKFRMRRIFKIKN